MNTFRIRVAMCAHFAYIYKRDTIEIVIGFLNKNKSFKANRSFVIYERASPTTAITKTKGIARQYPIIFKHIDTLF